MSLYHEDRVKMMRIDKVKFTDIDSLLKEYENTLEHLQYESNSNVNHPSHYNKGRECIDIMIDYFGKEAVANFCICNWYKYLYRAGSKESNSVEQDKAKAYWYYNKYKELISEN